MKYEKVLFSPKTNFSEVFSADQLWGQMVWAISDLKGSDAASDFVASFKSDPPFLISSLMIDGCFPVPIVSDTKIRDDKELEIAKYNKKCRWISLDDFKEFQKNTEFLFNTKLNLEFNNSLKGVIEVHPSISRLTNIVEEKKLFNSQYVYSNKKFCIYIKYLADDEKWKALVKEVIGYWSQIGLGGDRNVGHGQFGFEIVEINSIEKEIFEFNKGNSEMTLSKCFGPDLVPISYKLDVYTGIVGNGLSDSSLFRKKPIIEFLPGSIFAEGKGCIAEMVSTDSRVCSYGYVFPISVSLKV